MAVLRLAIMDLWNESKSHSLSNVSQIRTVRKLLWLLHWLLAAYQLLRFVWVSCKNSILLVGNLSLHSNTPWSRPHWRDACCLESEEECLSAVPAAWTPLSGACSVCMSGQEGETDPLNSLELAHSQESVTWVSQPESASRDCLTLYRCLMVAFPCCTRPAVKGLLTKR